MPAMNGFLYTGIISDDHFATVFHNATGAPARVRIATDGYLEAYTVKSPVDDNAKLTGTHVKLGESRVTGADGNPDYEPSITVLAVPAGYYVQLKQTKTGAQGGGGTYWVR